MSRIRELFDTLRAERQAILDQSMPLRQQRDQLLADIQPMLEQVRALEAQYRAIEQPRLADLDNEIAALAIGMGARRMSQPATDVR